MMYKMYKSIIRKFLFLLTVFITGSLNSFAEETVKRGRNEGTLFIPASNVMGNGNITAYADLGGNLSTNALEGNADCGATIGIAGLLQFNIQTSFINFSRIGPTEAHLQLTLPGNNRLRFAGFALIGDLFLSTSLDTIDETADATKPEYNPYPLFSLIADLDWLARPKKLPIKSYVSFSLADNPRFLYEYKQIAAKSGIELKMYQHSIFFDIGVGMFKEKHSKLLEKPKYDQKYVWISPGGRYRLRNRFSLLANFRCTVYRDIDEDKRNNSLNQLNWLSLQVKFEAPILFRETDSEAIRTMVFIEKRKAEKEALRYSEGTDFKKTINNKLEQTLSDLKEEDETFDYKKEKEDLLKRREQIETIMEEIEELLKEEE